MTIPPTHDPDGRPDPEQELFDDVIMRHHHAVHVEYLRGQLQSLRQLAIADREHFAATLKDVDQLLWYVQSVFIALEYERGYSDSADWLLDKIPEVRQAIASAIHAKAPY
jgi:hypothetical protein